MRQIAYVGAPGIEPISAWQCPSTHIIKGKFTPSSGERCIYHVHSWSGLQQDQT